MMIHWYIYIYIVYPHIGWHLFLRCFATMVLLHVLTLWFCWTKMATGSVDNGLQESFRGLRVKGQPCVWCGGLSGWLRGRWRIGWVGFWTEKQKVVLFARVVEAGIQGDFDTFWRCALNILFWGAHLDSVVHSLLSSPCVCSRSRFEHFYGISQWSPR